MAASLMTTLQPEEALWIVLELLGLWMVVRIWREAGAQLVAAERWLAEAQTPADALEAQAMVLIAADRQRRNAVLTAILLSGAILGLWSALVPRPIRAEIQAFNLGAATIFLLRDALLVWASWRSLATGSAIDKKIRARREVLDHGCGCDHE